MENEIKIGNFFRGTRYTLTIKHIADYIKEATDNFTMEGTEWLKGEITEDRLKEIFLRCCYDVQDKLMDSILPNLREVIEEAEIVEFDGIELRTWLQQNPKNSVIGDDGRDRDLNYWYEDYGVRKIWIEEKEVRDEEDHGLTTSVVVETPKSRVNEVELIRDVHCSGCEVSYSEDRKLIFIHFD